MTRTDRIRSDFDELAALAEPGASGRDRHDAFLLSLIPAPAARVLDVGCGLGRLTLAIAAMERDVVGVDLSPAMIRRAREADASDRVTFLVGDFMQLEFGGRSFDCVISAAALHHMDHEPALARMAGLVSPGGRLIVHDLKANAGVWDLARGCVALAHAASDRFVRTGRFRPGKRERDLWARHGASESYLGLGAVREMASRLLPGADVIDHWLWRYTLVWDKIPASPAQHLDEAIMKTRLEFNVRISAPRSAVWDTMLAPATYAEWTSAFCEGSHFKGSWAQGEKIQFLAPNGDGMTAVIAENRRHEYISIRQLGDIVGGVEDVTSDKVRAWAPAYENYTFSDVPGGTEIKVDVEVTPDFVEYMHRAYPKALDKLKMLCEGGR